MLFTPGTIPFKLFGADHIGVMTVLLASYIALYVFRKPLRNEKTDRTFRIGITVLLILEEVLFNTYRIANGMWMPSTSLPFHYCNMLIYAGMILMITKNRTLFNVVYLIGLAGPIQAIVTPALHEGFPHFRFIQFYFAHGIIIFCGLYFVFVHRYRPTFKSVIHTLILLNLTVPPLLLINYLTGGNYNNLSRVPDTPSLIDFLGPWPFYLIPLEFLAIFFIGLAYLPFAVQDLRAKRQRKQTGRMMKGQETDRD